MQSVSAGPPLISVTERPPLCRVCVAVTAAARSPRSGRRWRRWDWWTTPTRTSPLASTSRSTCSTPNSTRPSARFSSTAGLLVDGIVGEATYRALKEASYRLGARILNHQFGAPMYGDDVATLQARLQDLGFYTGLVDGHFGLADPQRADVLPARVRAVARRHLRPRDVALLVLSGLPRHRRFACTPSARKSWSAGPVLGCPASGSSSIRAAAAPTTGRSCRARRGRSAKQTSCGTWQAGSRAA